MASLFEKETCRVFIERIHKLDRKELPEWGRMNVAQMLHHCQKTFMIASGDLVPTINPVVKFLFGGRARKQLLRDAPFRKNLPTFPEGKVIDERTFEIEQEKLVTLVKNFQQLGPLGLTKAPHPFFGPLTSAEWDLLQVKHLDHHLRQFRA